MVVLTAYFDESGTHAQSDLALMAGFLGDARQWRRFEKRTTSLFRRFRVNIYHSIDVKRTDKDFAGWTVDRKIEFLDEFQHIVNEVLELGIVALMRAEDYVYYSGLPWPRGTRKDSLYTILFRACLSMAIEGAMHIDRWAFGEEPDLNVILESGHRNAQDAVRLYNFVRARFGGQSRALGGLTFENKENSLPLAAADLFAYSVYGLETGRKPIGVSKKPVKSEASYRGNAYRIVVDRDTLEMLHQTQMRDITSQD